MENKGNIKIKCDNLFVYGTLQHGQSRNYVLKGLLYKKATLNNYKKVIPPNLGFPFIIRDELSNVEGEIYFKVDDSLLNQLDLIEGEGHLYHRIIVKVRLDNGKILHAFTYYPSKILIKNYT